MTRIGFGRSIFHAVWLFFAPVLLWGAVGPAPLVIERVADAPVIDGAGTDSAWRAAAWQGGFYQLDRTNAPPAMQTRFKLIHDGARLYALIEAQEPETQDLRLVSGNTRDDIRLWRDDSVQLQLDPGGRGFGYFQFIVNWKSTVFDAYAEDDNRGMGTFVLRSEWNADVIAAARVDEAAWRVELSIPFAAFGLRADMPLEWGVNVCRSRYAGGASEHSACVPLHSDGGFGQPSRYRRATLAEFDPRPFQWLIGAPETKVMKEAGGFVCRLETTIQNQTGEFRIVTVRAEMTGVAKTSDLALKHLQEGHVSLAIPFEEAGTHDLTLTLARRAIPDTPAAGRQFTLELDYQPLRVKWIRPAYRDCIFASQRLETVLAAVVTEPEYADRPLTVTLAGETISPITHRFERAEPSRTVEFAAVDLPVGRYLLTASMPGVAAATVGLRNLPHVKGEVWLDAQGNTYVDGTPFLPFGWYGAPADMEPDMTALHTYGLWSDVAAIRAVLDRAEAGGKKLILVPFQGEKRWDDPIKDEARRGAFTKAHEARVRTVVNAIKDHPAILGWYMADEPEGRQHSVEWYKAAYALLSDIDPHHPCIMLNYGLRGIQTFYESCDILMPDCYPVFRVDGTTRKPLWALTEWTEAARALRPTWLVPQAFDWDGTGTITSPGRPPTFDEVRNQIWQVLAAGGRGILLYSYRSDSRTSCALRLGPSYIAREVSAFKPAFFGRDLREKLSLETAPADKHFAATLFGFGNDLLLVAVNTAYESRSARFRLHTSVPGDRLHVVGEQRSVALSEGTFGEDFGPLEVRLYTTSERLTEGFDVNGIRERIAAAERARLKPGNLVGLGGLPRHRLREIWASAPEGRPVIACSSRRMYASNRDRDWGILYLLDGLTTDVLHHSWVPRGHDKAPWLELALPDSSVIGRVVVYTPTFRGEAKLRGCRVSLRRPDGSLDVVGDIENNRHHAIEIGFAPGLAAAVRVDMTEFSADVAGCAETGLVTELEVYAK